MAGKFSSASRDSRAEEDKTKKWWIKNVQDQEGVDQDFARPTRSAGIDESRVQDQEVDRLIKKQGPRSNVYTDAQVGDAGDLFKSLWIIILQPQVNFSMCVSL